MNTEVALSNYRILKNLKPYQKLIVSENDNLQIDDRYLIGLRRWYDGSNRCGFYNCLDQTIHVLALQNTVNKTELVSDIEYLRKTLQITYPEFKDIHNLLANWITTIQCMDTKESNSSETDKLLPQEQTACSDPTDITVDSDEEYERRGSTGCYRCLLGFL